MGVSTRDIRFKCEDEVVLDYSSTVMCGKTARILTAQVGCAFGDYWLMSNGILGCLGVAVWDTKARAGFLAHVPDEWYIDSHDRVTLATTVANFALRENLCGTYSLVGANRDDDGQGREASARLFAGELEARGLRAAKSVLGLDNSILSLSMHAQTGRVFIAYHTSIDDLQSIQKVERLS